MFEAGAGADGWLSTIAVSVPVQAEQFASEARPPSTPDGVGRIVLGGDPEVHERLERALQAFESHVSFSTVGALRRVLWQTAEQNTIPDTPEDVALVKVTGWRTQRSYDERAVRVAPHVLAGMASAAERLDELTVAKAFLREGSQELEQFRYIQAFNAFYFVIEGLYARGRTSEREVIKALRLAPEFTEDVKTVLDTFRGGPLRHLCELWPQLESLYDVLRSEPTVDGTSAFLFRLRGRLHHYQGPGARLRPTPFTQDLFEGAAILANYLATMAIGRREVTLNRGAG